MSGDPTDWALPAFLVLMGAGFFFFGFAACVVAVFGVRIRHRREVVVR